MVRYEADVHCCQCARERFGGELDSEDAQDDEGNEVHPMLEGEEYDAQGEYCGECGYEIVEPYTDCD